MTTTVELDPRGPVVILRVRGALDEKGAARVHAKVDEALCTGLKNLVLNLADVTKITPDGVMLIEAIRHDVTLCGGQLVLTKPRPETAELLNIYGLFNQLVVLPSEKDAVRRIDACDPAAWTAF